MKRAGLVLLGVSAIGCQCEEDRPYTPYTVTVGPSTSSSAAPPPSASVTVVDASAPFARQPALLAPRGTESWLLEGQTLKAPADRVFERALVADFDADGQREIVAWTVKRDELLRAPAGELWLYPAAGKPRRLAELPGFVPSGPGCTLHTELTQTGPRTVTLESEGRCSAAQLARTPVRSLLVLAPAAAQPVLLGLRVAEPAPGERLTIEVATNDRDDDGQDDVAVKVSLLAEGTSRAASATLGWFQRGGRALREAGEPARSLAKAASTEVVRARSKKSAASAAEGAGNLRRLAGSLCAESGTERLLDAEGRVFKCGDLTSFVDRTAEAELQAALSRGDVLHATSVLERDGWYFGRISAAQRKALTRLLEKHVAQVTAVELAAPTARPARKTAAPRYSPLAFQPSGALLVRTFDGVVRVSGDPPQEEPLDPEAGIAPWPLEVLAPDGKRWQGVAHACDRSELMLLTSPASSLPAPLLAARPGPCNRAAPAPAGLVPIVWNENVFQAVIAGVLITLPSNGRVEPSARLHPGSPYAPDGSRWAVATRLGVLVLGGERAELWRTEAVDPSASSLAECVPSPGGERLACVDQGRVRWFRRP